MAYRNRRQVELALDRVEWQVPVLAVLNLWVLGYYESWLLEDKLNMDYKPLGHANTCVRKANMNRLVMKTQLRFFSSKVTLFDCSILLP